jgi:hypothetical protein
MKRILWVIVAFMPLAMAAATLQAADSTKAKAGTSTTDWRYVWHEGRWWYWMPSNRWMVWTDSRWAPFATQSQTRTAFYGSYDSAPEAEAVQPATAVGAYCPPEQSRYSGGISNQGFLSNGGGGYSGYGWSWGPGTQRGSW